REPVVEIAGDVLERLVDAELARHVRDRGAHLPGADLERDAVPKPLAIEPKRDALVAQRWWHALGLPEPRQLVGAIQRLPDGGCAPGSEREKVLDGHGGSIGVNRNE